MEKQLPQPGWRYRHFKGGLYQIVTLALNTETGEDMVSLSGTLMRILRSTSDHFRCF